MKTLIVVALALLPLSPKAPSNHHPQALPHSELVQAFGAYCQTPFGVCPLVQPNGVPYSAPVGSLCFCGKDAGQVRQ